MQQKKRKYGDNKLKGLTNQSTMRAATNLFFCLLVSIVSLLFWYCVIPHDLCANFKENPCIDIIKDTKLAMAGIVGTVLAIIFSMILLVIERISSKYSTKFLTHILRNPILIITIVYSSILVIAYIFPIQDDDHRSYLCMMLAAFTLFFTLFIVSLKETIRLMNPMYSILGPEVEQTKKWIKKVLALTESAQSSANPNGRPYVVPNEIEQNIEERLLPIRDIIIRSIADNNLEEATGSICAFTLIILYYLDSRRNFYADSDKLLFFVYSEFQNISSSALKTGYLHYRLHPLLICELSKIAKKALSVKVNYWEQTSSNNLLAFPIQGIEILCLQNLSYSNSSAPSIACVELENLALLSINKGYVQETLSILEKLSKISLTTLKLSINWYFLSHSANTSIMKTTIHMAKKRLKLTSKQNSDYIMKMAVESVIVKITDRILEKEDINQSLFNPLNPIMCELYEFRMNNNQFNLAILTENLLYAANDPCLINDGLSIIQYDIYSRIFYPYANKLDDEPYPQTRKFIDTLYLCQLCVLSLFNPKLRKSLYKEAPDKITDGLDKRGALDCFDAGMDILWRYFIRQERRCYIHNRALDALFSLVIICMIDNNTDCNLAKRAKNKISSQYQEYRKTQYSGQETFFKYCRALNMFMKNTKNAKTNILTKVPKYKPDSTPVLAYEWSDNSLPKNNHTETRFFAKDREIKQWEILGAHTMRNEYLNSLSRAIWGKKE